MDSPEGSFAKRCLPLLIANQSGWFILNNIAVELLWDGGCGRENLHISTDAGPAQTLVSSHFGNGIATWSVPYLFRTPPGYNLAVRHPVNHIKDGVQALEGIVEADWAVATFTVNWKVTRANHPIRFAAGEPICMIHPERRGELEDFEAQVCDLSANPDLSRSHYIWQQSRKRLLYKNALIKSNAWEKHYFRGTAPCGIKSEGHQTVLHLKPFSRV